MGKRLSTILVLLCCLWPGREDHVHAATAMLGTGFAVTADGLVVTNDHVTAGCTDVFLQHEGARYRGKVVARDQNNDLALIQVQLGEGKTSAFATLRQPRSLRAGEQAITYGFPLRGALSIEGNLTIGYVSAMRGLRDSPHYIQMTTPVQPGNSGGALLDSSANVIGVVAAKLNAMKVQQVTGDVPQNVNFAVELETLRDFLLRHGARIQSAGPVRELSPADVGERARQFTYLVACPSTATQAAVNVPTVNLPPTPGAEPIPMVPDVRRSETADAEPAFLQPGGGADLDARQSAGRAVWRSQADRSAAVAQARIDIPDQKLAMNWSLRRNANPAIEVSHTIELMFTVPSGFAHGGIAGVSGMSIRHDKTGEATTLAGTAVELSNGLFVFGVSGGAREALRTLELLGSDEWIDVNVAYKDGLRGVLTIHTGDVGTRALKAALASP